MHVKTSSHDYIKHKLKWLIGNGPFNMESYTCDGCLSYA